MGESYLFTGHLKLETSPQFKPSSFDEKVSPIPPCQKSNIYIFCYAVFRVPKCAPRMLHPFSGTLNIRKYILLSSLVFSRKCKQLPYTFRRGRNALHRLCSCQSMRQAPRVYVTSKLKFSGFKYPAYGNFGVRNMLLQRGKQTNWMRVC